MLTVEARPRLRLACWEGDMGGEANGLTQAALAQAQRLAEASDLLESTVEAGDVPDEVLAGLLPDLRRLAEGAEAALATAEAPCVSRSRSFFPPGCKKARQAAEAATLPGATKPDSPDPRPALCPGDGGRAG